MLSFDIAGAQIDGARDYQEDAFLITHLGDQAGQSGSLLIVADGMGGHAAGNVASNMAVQTFNKCVTAKFPASDLAEVLRGAVEEANHSIAETVRETAALKGMGCTLVAAVVKDARVHWVSVGDSHLYLVRGGEVQKKNADHSYGGFLDRMAAQGTPVEAESGFSRNMLMSALTGEDIADVDCPPDGLVLEPGDRVVIASDGLDTLSQGQIVEYCEQAETARSCVEMMLEAVEEADLPKQDNTTIIVVAVAETGGDASKEAPAKPAATAPGGGGPPPPQPFRPSTPRAPAEPRRPKRARGRSDSRRSPFGTVVAVVAVVAIAGAGAYFYLQGQLPLPGMTAPWSAAPPPEPEVPETASEPPPEPSPADSGPRVAVEVEPAPTFRDPAGPYTTPLMARLPGGTYQMGSRASSIEFDEKPQHEVTVPPFAIGVTEVSVAEYAAFARATGRRMPDVGRGATATTPMTFVSWRDAMAYTVWLSQVTGERYRLPTEAEWEYAARAGTVDVYWWGRRLDAGRAHCVACENPIDPRAPTDIASFPPNPFGLFDTAGNVQEWTADCYREDYEGAPTDGSAVDAGNCAARVVRGGSYTSGPKAVRPRARDRLPPNEANDFTGFRVARDLPSAP